MQNAERNQRGIPLAFHSAFCILTSAFLLTRSPACRPRRASALCQLAIAATLSSVESLVGISTGPAPVICTSRAGLRAWAIHLLWARRTQRQLRHETHLSCPRRRLRGQLDDALARLQSRAARPFHPR